MRSSEICSRSRCRTSPAEWDERPASGRLGRGLFAEALVMCGPEFGRTALWLATRIHEIIA